MYYTRVSHTETSRSETSEQRVSGSETYRIVNK